MISYISSAITQAVSNIVELSKKIVDEKSKGAISAVGNSSHTIGKPSSLNISDEQWSKIPDSQRANIVSNYSEGINRYSYQSINKQKDNNSADFSSYSSGIIGNKFATSTKNAEKIVDSYNNSNKNNANKGVKISSTSAGVSSVSTLAGYKGKTSNVSGSSTSSSGSKNVNSVPTLAGYKGKTSTVSSSSTSSGSKNLNNTATNTVYNGKPSNVSITSKPSTGSNNLNRIPTGAGYNGTTRAVINHNSSSNAQNNSSNSINNRPTASGSTGVNSTPTRPGYVGRSTAGFSSSTPGFSGCGDNLVGSTFNINSAASLPGYRGNDYDYHKFDVDTSSMMLTEEVEATAAGGSSFNTNIFGLEKNVGYENYDYEKLQNDDLQFFDEDSFTYVLGPNDRNEGILVKDNNVYIDNTDPNNPVYKRYNPETKQLSNISIFDNENVDSRQYGVDQMDWYEDFDELINDEFIWNELQRVHPVSEFKSEDEAMEFYEKYLHNNNCGYAAATNAIFTYFEGRENEFEDTFGFPMYKVDNKGNLDFNYEYLQLLYYDYVNPKIGKSADSKVQVNGLEKFLGQYGIKLDKSSLDSIDKILPKEDVKVNKKLKEDFDKNDSIFIGVSGYDLYDMEGHMIAENCEGHAMTVVGFTNDGYPIVSSWGSQYVVDINGSNYSKKNFCDVAQYKFS